VVCAHTTTNLPQSTCAFYKANILLPYCIILSIPEPSMTLSISHNDAIVTVIGITFLFHFVTLCDCHMWCHTYSFAWVQNKEREKTQNKIKENKNMKIKPKGKYNRVQSIVHDSDISSSTPGKTILFKWTVVSIEVWYG